MKNITLLLVLLFSFSAIDAQINLEQTFPSENIFQGYFSVVKFGYLGEKYVVFKGADSVIQIYSLNYVLEKTIAIPPAIINSFYTVTYVSDNLFDLDTSIEYLLIAPYDGIPTANYYVVKEDGSIIIEMDSCSTNSVDQNELSSFNGIYPTASGTKLLLRKYNTGYQVYSLPGSLPCYECSNGVYTGNFSPSGGNENRNASLSNAFPNPASNQTRIEYKLPDGISQGEIIFYNTRGNEIKRFKVSNAFSFIYVSTHDLPSDTYYYILQTSAGNSDGKKMVVIR